MLTKILEITISIIYALVKLTVGIVVAIIVIPLHLIFAPLARKKNGYINKNPCLDRDEEPE